MVASVSRIFSSRMVNMRISFIPVVVLLVAGCAASQDHDVGGEPVIDLDYAQVRFVNLTQNVD